MRFRGRRGRRQPKPQRNKPNLRVYIYRVLKQVHPDTGISCMAMNVVKDLVWDMFRRILKEAINITEIFNKKTLSSREVQTAVRLELPGELAKHAVSEGTKAVTKFCCFDNGGGGGGSGGARGKSFRRKVTTSCRAGLQFPVGSMRAVMKRLFKFRIGRGAPVYMTAVMEYLTAEVLELAGNAARDNRKRRITPRHLMLAIQNDQELGNMTRRCYVAQGGVLPNIHSFHFVQKKKPAVAPPVPMKKAAKPMKAAAAKKPMMKQKGTTKGFGKTFTF